MGLLTYQSKIGTRPIAIKARKDEAENLARRLKMPVELNKYCRELMGVVGGEEHATVLWSPFTSYTPTDPENYRTAVTAYLESLPPTITPETATPYLTRAKEICDRHIPILDRRLTQDAVAQRNAETALVQAQRQADSDEWRARFARDDTAIPLPPGQMAVTLEMTFDDSDSQTDYFHPHAGIGDTLLLALVPKQSEREALARKVLAKYPELSKLTWTWHTENYSMGHGNYLMSEFWGEEPRKAYDHREAVSVRWEIQMTTYNNGGGYLPYRDYPGQADPVGDFLATLPQGNGNGATVRRNESLNGIEILFPGKPAQAVLDSLKQMGFRWSKFQSLWYTRFSPETLEQVNILLKGG